MVNLIQIVGLCFFFLTALEFWAWRGLPETPWGYGFLLATFVLFGLAEIIRRMPKSS
jgi:hypothetical protein